MLGYLARGRFKSLGLLKLVLLKLLVVLRRGYPYYLLERSDYLLVGNLLRTYSHLSEFHALNSLYYNSRASLDNIPSRIKIIYLAGIPEANPYYLCHCVSPLVK